MKSKLIKIGIGILCFLIVANSNPEEGSQRSINGLLVSGGIGLIIWGVFFSTKKENRNRSNNNILNNKTQLPYNNSYAHTKIDKFVTHLSFSGMFCYEYEYIVDDSHISYPTARMVSVNRTYNLTGKISRRKKGESQWQDLGAIKNSIQESGEYILLDLK